MAYDARYDPSLDFTMDYILAWTQHMLGGGTAFSTATQPTLAQVESMIDGQVMNIGGMLERNGYGTAQPVVTVGTEVTTIISTVVAAGAVSDIELTQPTSGGLSAPDQTAPPNPRYRFFTDKLTNFGKLVEGPTLQYMGALRARDASNGLTVLGASWDEQEDIHDDEDRKDALFPRGFQDPQQRRNADTTGTVEPVVT